MIKKYLGPLIAGHRRALQEQKGQSIVIITFAFLGLIALLGIALDLGLVYIERVRIGRTADAAALAAVIELPYEEEAMRRAIEYIELNGYDVGVDTQVYVRGCIRTGASDFRNVTNLGPRPGTEAVQVVTTSAITGYPYPPIVSNPRSIFVIDTLAYQPVDRNGATVTTKNQDNCNYSSNLFGKANKLRVTGEVKVDMNFMQFFGFGRVPVQDEAVGENVTSLDIAVVFDVSGSMDYETNCFGCWREKTPKPDVMSNPFPTNGQFYTTSYAPYEAGGAAQYTPSSNLCTADTAVFGNGGYSYLAHEAEFYSQNSTAGHPRGWEFSRRSAGQGFWAVQKVDRGSNLAFIRAHPMVTYSQSQADDYPQLQGMSYNSECFDTQGQCWRTRADGLGVPPPASLGTVPYVEYDFRLPAGWTGQTHIWIRAVGGGAFSAEWNGQSPNNLIRYDKAIFWQLDSLTVRGGPFSRFNQGPERAARSVAGRTPEWQPEIDDADWRWVKLGGETLAAGQPHTLRLYQGSSSFNVDKIVITNNPWGDVNYGFGNTGNGLGGSSGTGYSSIKAVLQRNGGRGPDATAGSATREACNACNPIYGGKSLSDPIVENTLCSCKKNRTDTTPTALYPAGGTGTGCNSLDQPSINMRENDLYHDVDPLRSAQEAVKNFAIRLDPRFDQLGLIGFSTGMVGPRVKLQCMVYAQENLGGAAKCYDTGTSPISYTNLIRDLEDHNNVSTTNIPMGMREGLEELGLKINNTTVNDTNFGECSTSTNVNGDGFTCDRRGAAKRILILMTDGSPNQTTGCPGATTLWRGRFGQGQSSYGCSLYYAREAADSQVTVYTIGIGSGVNVELLTTMATGTDPNPVSGDDGFYFEGRGGKFYKAANPSQLDTIFEDILDNIFVRIVG